MDLWLTSHLLVRSVIRSAARHAAMQPSSKATKTCRLATFENIWESPKTAFRSRVNGGNSVFIEDGRMVVPFVGVFLTLNGFASNLVDKQHPTQTTDVCHEANFVPIDSER